MTQKLLLPVCLFISLISSAFSLHDLAILKKIVDVHNNKGGSTFDVKTGQNYSGENGYAVALYSNDKIVVQGKYLTPDDIINFLDLNHIFYDLELPNIVSEYYLIYPYKYLIGTWFDEDNNVSMIEVTLFIPDEAMAISIGRNEDQEAIYNLKTGRTIFIKEYLFKN